MSSVELREGIDLPGLREWARSDPLPHAFALYDAEHFPEQIRFASVQKDGKLVSYLIIWYGEPSVPIVHWVGETEPELLARGLPAPPYVAIVPPRVADVAHRAAQGHGRYVIRVLRRRSSAGPVRERGTPHPGVKVRRLGPPDVPLMQEFARAQQEDPVMQKLGSVDPKERRLLGAVVERPTPRLLACARTTLELPELWMIGGVYTDPAERGKGLARAVVGALVEEARARRADSALYVREDNLPAVRAYEALGFQEEFRRVWIDAGGGPPPSLSSPRRSPSGPPPT